MIIKSTRQQGNGLAPHLLNDRENERVRVLDPSGFADSDLEANITQCQAEVRGTRARAGVMHVVISPSPHEPDLSRKQLQQAWKVYGKEFDIQGAHQVVEHRKNGRRHFHVVAQGINPDGRAVEMSFSKVRNEKVARTLEHDLGHEPIKGRHNRAVFHQLERDGRHDIAKVMQNAGLINGERPEAALAGNEYQQQERTDIAKVDVIQAVAEAWCESDSQSAFQAALAEVNLALAQGDKTIQVLDPEGGTHDLRRTLRKAGVQVKKKDIDACIASAQLTSVADVRAAQVGEWHAAGTEYEEPVSANLDELDDDERHQPETPQTYDADSECTESTVHERVVDCATAGDQPPDSPAPAPSRPHVPSFKEAQQQVVTHHERERIKQLRREVQQREQEEKLADGELKQLVFRSEGVRWLNPEPEQDAEHRKQEARSLLDAAKDALRAILDAIRERANDLIRERRQGADAYDWAKAREQAVVPKIDDPASQPESTSTGYDEAVARQNRRRWVHKPDADGDEPKRRDPSEPGGP